MRLWNLQGINLLTDKKSETKQMRERERERELHQIRIKGQSYKIKGVKKY